MNNRLKALIAMFVFGVLAIPAQAQFHMGPRAGINLSSMSTNAAGATVTSQLGIHGGLSVRYEFHDQLSVQMDALYSQMGAVSTTELTAGNVITTTKSTSYLTYVQTPLYVNFEMPLKQKQLIPYRVKSSFVSFHLYGGGYFGYGLGAQAKTDVTVNNNDGTAPVTTAGTKADVAEGTFNEIDFGALAGIGFSFKLDEEDKQRVSVDARYLLGFGNTSNIQGAEETNSAIQASIGYSVKLTKRRYIRH